MPPTNTMNCKHTSTTSRPQTQAWMCVCADCRARNVRNIALSKRLKRKFVPETPEERAVKMRAMRERILKWKASKA
jgi:hypothetical protein